MESGKGALMNEPAEGRNMRWTYENLYVECPWCGHPNILNRKSDLAGSGPIDRIEVPCSSPDCSRSFHVSGDMISPAYEMIIFDCDELLERKQFMYSALNLAQAFEVFISHYFRVELIYRPFWADVRAEKEIGSLKSLDGLLYVRTKRFSFTDMKNLFICHLLYEDHPKSLIESEEIIRKIPLRPRPHTNDEIRKAQRTVDGRVRDLLVRLNSCKVAELRNRVVHKLAYRPDENEARAALKETREILFQLARDLQVQAADANWYGRRS